MKKDLLKDAKFGERFVLDTGETAIYFRKSKPVVNIWFHQLITEERGVIDVSPGDDCFYQKDDLGYNVGGHIVSKA